MESPRKLTMRERWDADDKINLEVLIWRRLYPLLLGSIVGDALGVPVEFCQRNPGVTDMIGYGTYNQPPGTWSDDTSLSLCLMQNIIDRGNENDLMQKFVNYRDHGYLTPFGKMFDIGGATNQAITSFKSGIPANQCGGKNEADNGNGALMRIAPLAGILWSEMDFIHRKKEIERVAAITHAHPRSQLACIFYVEFLIKLFCNNDPIQALGKTIDNCKRYLSNTLYSAEFETYSRIFDESLLSANKGSIHSDGYVAHSLEAALWCFFNTDNFHDAVLQAVNLGGDTDTIAAITGAIAGVYYKIDDIPEKWINQLANSELVLGICNNFVDFCVNQECIKEYGSPMPR